MKTALIKVVISDQGNFTILIGGDPITPLDLLMISELAKEMAMRSAHGENQPVIRTDPRVRLK
jgi:hypothetical protein